MDEKTHGALMSLLTELVQAVQELKAGQAALRAMIEKPKKGKKKAAPEPVHEHVPEPEPVLEPVLEPEPVPEPVPEPKPVGIVDHGVGEDPGPKGPVTPANGATRLGIAEDDVKRTFARAGLPEPDVFVALVDNQHLFIDGNVYTAQELYTLYGETQREAEKTHRPLLECCTPEQRVVAAVARWLVTAVPQQQQ